MKTHTCTTYKIGELSEKAKKRAIEYARDHFWEFNCDALSDWFKQDLEDHYGYDNCKVWWSLSYCQGDGVCFEGHPDMEYIAKHDEELAAMLREFKTTLALQFPETEEEGWSVEIECNDRCHRTTVSVNCHDYYYDCKEYQHLSGTIDEWRIKLEKHLQARVKTICDEMEECGYSDIEYQQTDEALEEWLEANDYEFTESGKWAWDTEWDEDEED